MLNYILGSLILVISYFLLLKFYEHALMILLCIEFIVVINLLNFYMILMNYGKDFYLLMFMVIFVIEGVLGISLIVMMIRFKGNEYFKNFNLFMW
uniref:NADH dehydrogenase subunit 4L n=1 Tax=Dolichovespula xanthicincta TaxID=2982222 RepID=A0A977XDB6_9HYME|nr:NADH dehydrogenase subunit 4L [Dolichovespula xanthicincta]